MVLALAAASLTATATIAACTDSNPGKGLSESGNGNGPEKRIGVILPDTASAARWSTHDPVYFREAFDAAGIKAEIANAGDDPKNFERIGNAMIDNGVRVLIITSLDPVSGKAVLHRARREGIPTIDYDRLTLNGGADYHVGFDDETIGRQQAHGLSNCLAAKNRTHPIVATLNGPPRDYNAALRKDGYDSVLEPKYDGAIFTKGPEQWVPDGDNAEARRTFEQMLKQFPRIGGVIAPNDGIANEVIEVLRKRKLNGKVPVVGHEATVQGLQNVLAGDQCATVYRRIKLETQTAATLAIRLAQGERPTAHKQIKDPESGAHIPFFPLEPYSVDVTQVKEVVADRFVTRSELCAGRYAKLCAKYGVIDPGERQ